VLSPKENNCRNTILKIQKKKKEKDHPCLLEEQPTHRKRSIGAKKVKREDENHKI